MYISYPLASFTALFLRKLLFLLESLSFPTDGILAPISIKNGDTLILLDSSWHSSFLEYVGTLKEKGLRIVTVVYDLIPVTHSHLCHDSLASIFENWVQWIVKNSDGFITISQTIQKELESYIIQKNIERKKEPWFEHFYLGYDIPNKKEELLDQKIANIFKKEKNVYLVVGTIEPRKNHAYIIDAFNILWAQKIDVAVCFVGKIGWKHNNIVSSIHSHEKYQNGLYLFSSLNDKSLDFAYQNSKSLIIASFVEGFGLPIVEALEKGLPVMASDIPVFREIGEDYISYFDLSNPTKLAEKIKEFETKKMHTKDIKEWNWISWESSANQFFEKIDKKMQTSDI